MPCDWLVSSQPVTYEGSVFIIFLYTDTNYELGLFSLLIMLQVLSAYHQLRNMSMQLRLRKRKSKAIQGVSMETSSSGSSVEVITVQVS